MMFAVCLSAQASSVLLRSTSSEPPELIRVKTFDRTADATVTPVRPASPVTIAVLVDTMSPDALEALKTDLLAGFGSLRGRNLRLAIVQNNAVRVVGPLLSRLRLQNALKDVQPLTENATPAAKAAMLDLLSTNADQLGSKWSHVLLAGDFPSLDPATLQYASAVLLRAFIAEQVQVSWHPVTKGDDAWLPLFESTGGAILHEELKDSFAAPQEVKEQLLRVEWTSAPPSAGFVVSLDVLSDSQGNALLKVPDLALRETVSLPSIERFAEVQSQVSGVAPLLNAPQLGEPDTRRIRETLTAAFEINPLDPAALGVAIAFYGRTNDFSSVVKYAQSLVEAHPEEGTAYAALGHALLRTNDLDKADAALERAAALHIQSAQVAEDSGRVRLARKDDKGAVPYLAEALRLDPARQELWFDQAHAAERLRDSGLAMESFEKGLALGGSHVPESLSLLHLYLSSNQSAKALDFTTRVIKDLPPDPAVRSQFASGLDEQKQSSQALVAWRRVLEVQPDAEPAHCRIARLLFDSGDAKGSEEAAEKGLEAAPKSPRLYIVMAEARKKQGHRYSAREALRKGAGLAPDPDLLSHFAAVEDTYGSGAADAYARLADSLGAAAPERLQALERGFAVSVRDADLKHATTFAALLKASGRPEFSNFIGGEKQADSGTTVPGGLDALAFAVHARSQIPTERFFVEYSRALATAAHLNPTSNKSPIQAEIEKHFQTIATLEAMGKRDGDRVVIELSVDKKKSRKNTEEVLRVLGIKLHASKGEVEVKRGEKKSQAVKQETASALAVDEVGMQEALEAGKPYDLEIRDEWAPVYPNETMWRDAFYAKEKDPGGLASALARLPKMAELYVGMSSLDRKVIAELLGSLPLKTLYEKYSRLLYLYGPALGMNGEHAAVPGGVKAEPIWTQLAGASPAEPGAFFRALLERDEGRLFAFFFTMSGLDQAHQAFFEASASRTSQFYKLFAHSEEMQHVSVLGLRSSLSGFFRSVPLDSQGRLDFPGSPELWTVAAGHSASDAHINKLLKKLSKTAAPEVEDSVLLRLAETHSRDSHTVQHSELDNFLAVSRIDAHRPEPLDERSALILAQRYDEYGGAYAYFTDLTALTASDFTQFFAAADHIKSHPPLAANFQLGELNALIEWICLIKRRQAIGDNEARKLFQNVADHFASAADVAAYANASLESSRAILAACNAGKGQASPDDQIRACMLGVNGAQLSSVRGKAFQGVLGRQNVPRLENLFSVFDAVKTLSGNGPMHDEISTLRTDVAGLPRIELPQDIKSLGKEKDVLISYGLADATKRVEEIAQKAGKRKPNRKAIQKLAQELLAQLQPQITAALAGPVYAYFLRPTDLVVSEDPLLLRKHRYFDYVSPEAIRGSLIAESRFVPQSQGTGSYFEGGFALFGVGAGQAAVVGWKSGAGSSADAAVAQIASVRSTIWDSLTEVDQRLLALRIAIADEWIFESARVPEAFEALNDATIGLLSLSRRADLLNGIKARDWRKAQEAVTLADRLSLGGKYLERFKSDPWPSPVAVELREVAGENTAPHLDVLGPLRHHALGCPHSHLLLDAPYEEYERHLFPSEVAERAAEFKLYLAYLADGAGVGPAALADVAEPLLDKAFRSAQLTEPRDWHSLLAAYASVSAADLETALQP